jgi:hypothetical protein
MRVLSLVAAAVALAGTANAAASTVLTYTVNCQTTYVVQNGDTVCFLFCAQLIFQLD